MPKGQNLTLVIDELNPGGSQRQLAMLAIGLKERFYNVEVLVYHKDQFFLESLAEAGIPVLQVHARNKMHLVFAMRNAIRQRKPTGVIAFLSGPSKLAETSQSSRWSGASTPSARACTIA